MSSRTFTRFWRRLNGRGHDACRLTLASGGWEIVGGAVFADAGHECHLSYAITGDGAFRTKSATIEGFIGRKTVSMRIRASDGKWTLNGVPQPELRGLIDLDLGFTPATNLVALRRLDLSVGEAAQAPAAYVEFPKTTLGVLDQHYERLSPTAYAYTAPRFGYNATLQVDDVGFVVKYPRLFHAVQR